MHNFRCHAKRNVRHRAQLQIKQAYWIQLFFCFVDLHTMRSGMDGTCAKELKRIRFDSNARKIQNICITWFLIVGLTTHNRRLTSQLNLIEFKSQQNSQRFTRKSLYHLFEERIKSTIDKRERKRLLKLVGFALIRICCCLSCNKCSCYSKLDRDVSNITTVTSAWIILGISISISFNF